MALSKNSNRKTISMTINSDLYEQIQKKSKESNIPISRLLERSAEEYLNKDFKTVKISDNLYQFFEMYFGFNDLDVDEGVETILMRFFDNKKKIVEQLMFDPVTQDNDK